MPALRVYYNRPDLPPDASRGRSLVIGVDEVGRGSLAGPVAVCAVLVPDDFFLDGASESKRVSAAKRAALYDALPFQVRRYAIATASPHHIDQVNIRNATLEAMALAVSRLRHDHCFPAMIDGNACPLGLSNAECIVGGDALFPAIGMASIIAKVYRDRLMALLSNAYPAYGWDRNSGYGTKEHYMALSLVGASPIHRSSFRLF